MELTEQQKTEIKKSFGVRRKRQIIFTVLLVAVLSSFAFFEDKIGRGAIAGISPEMAGPLLFAFVLSALIFSVKNWRCPSCNKYLGKTMNPKFCNHCGVELR